MTEPEESDLDWMNRKVKEQQSKSIELTKQLESNKYYERLSGQKKNRAGGNNRKKTKRRKK